MDEFHYSINANVLSRIGKKDEGISIDLTCKSYFQELEQDTDKLIFFSRR